VQPSVGNHDLKNLKSKDVGYSAIIAVFNNCFFEKDDPQTCFIIEIELHRKPL